MADPSRCIEAKRCSNAGLTHTGATAVPSAAKRIPHFTARRWTFGSGGGGLRAGEALVCLRCRLLHRSELRTTVVWFRQRPTSRRARGPASAARTRDRLRVASPDSEKMRDRGFTGSTNRDDDIEYSFAHRAGVVGFVQHPKGVMVRVAFDADPAHPEAQQRQGWQVILNTVTKHGEASQ